MILSLVSMTLLLLRNNHISLHQSSNFVLSPLNHPGSGTIFLDIVACLLFIVGAGAGAVDISVSDCLYSSKALFMICKDPSLSDNASILSILLELVLVPLCGLYHTCFIYCPVVTLPNFICGLTTIHLFLQDELIDALPNVMTLVWSSGCT